MGNVQVYAVFKLLENVFRNLFPSPWCDLVISPLFRTTSPYKFSFKSLPPICHGNLFQKKKCSPYFIGENLCLCHTGKLCEEVDKKLFTLCVKLNNSFKMHSKTELLGQFTEVIFSKTVFKLRFDLRLYCSVFLCSISKKIGLTWPLKAFMLKKNVGLTNKQSQISKRQDKYNIYDTNIYPNLNYMTYQAKVFLVN